MAVWGCGCEEGGRCCWEQWEGVSGCGAALTEPLELALIGIPLVPTEALLSMYIISFWQIFRLVYFCLLGQCTTDITFLFELLSCTVRIMRVHFSHVASLQS